MVVVDKKVDAKFGVFFMSVYEYLLFEIPSHDLNFCLDDSQIFYRTTTSIVLECRVHFIANHLDRCEKKRL